MEMEESSFKIKNDDPPQENMQVEENNLDMLPRKKTRTSPIGVSGASNSNMLNYKVPISRCKTRSEVPRMVIKKNPMEEYIRVPCLDSMQLREMNPNFIPVTLKKDAMSDIPDIITKIYHVSGDTTLGEFVDIIRFLISLSKEKPIFVFFKNTEPPTGALMSAIDEQNKDEDGFLHITYSGEEKNVNVRTQAEKNYPDPVPMIVENAPARSHKPDIEEQKNSSENKWKWPITLLDPWNGRLGNMNEEECLENNLRANPGMVKWKKKLIKRLLKHYKQRSIKDAGQMRQERPDWIPVCVEKDAESDITDIGLTKFHVPGDMPLGKFVEFIQRQMWPVRYKPIYGLFKNTEPSTDASIAEVDKENKDEDGYLHMTYSGEEKGVRGSKSNEEQECFAGSCESLSSI